MEQTRDIAIVGAGAAGLTAAIFAAQCARNRVVLLDGAARLGAKILVSGGGRCNVTHQRVSAGDYNGSRNIVRNVLAAFDAPAAVRWFASLGVELKCEEGGKLFPVTDSARTVLDALLHRCEQLGVRICPRCRVSDVVAPAQGGDGFTVCTAKEKMPASRVILATGGRSLPLSGSDGGGWNIARRLGHSVTETHPALSPLALEASFFHAGLSGLSQIVELKTFVNGKCIDQRTGSLLWTHFGISGPVVLDASRHWTSARGSGQAVEMRANFLPGKDFAQAERWLIDQIGHGPKVSLLNVLRPAIPQRFAEAIVRHAGMDSTIPAGQLAREARRKLLHGLTALPLPVLGDRGWNHAEVTAGGVPLAEIDYRTMESRKVRGLHLAGEMLDCDGRIGGFNFHWAWATGYLAGTAAGV